jgi:glycosyltransferase involved in cell wall biosynthesis
MRDALAFAGLPTDRVRIIPHRAPPVSVPESTVGSPLRIGFLGTLRPHKGAHVFVEAARALPREINCQLTVRGDLAIDLQYVAKLKQIATSDPRIQILDKVPYSKFGEAIGALDVVVIPSLWPENLPLVLLTAIEHGRYVVTSDMPGLAAAVGSDQGAIVPAGDASALAAVLERLVRNPAPVRTIRARKTPPPSFESYVDDLEAMYARARLEDGVRAA